jgi:hypothetical protein
MIAIELASNSEQTLTANCFAPYQSISALNFKVFGFTTGLRWSSTLFKFAWDCIINWCFDQVQILGWLITLLSQLLTSFLCSFARILDLGFTVIPSLHLL